MTRFFSRAFVILFPTHYAMKVGGKKGLDKNFSGTLRRYCALERSAKGWRLSGKRIFLIRSNRRALTYRSKLVQARFTCERINCVISDIRSKGSFRVSVSGIPSELDTIRRES